MKTAILAIILFFLMIFPHELGHFIAAKCCGVQVNEFSFGMGPALWKKKKGETLFAIRLFPIGGYCALEGEDFVEEVDDEGNVIEKPYNPRSLDKKKPWQKMVVIVAGSIMNIITAIVAMFLVLCISGYTTTHIASVEANSPAEVAGIQVNDNILYVNNTEIESWEQIASILNSQKENQTAFVVERNGKELTLLATPKKTEVYADNGELQGYRYTVGIACKVSHNPFKSFVNGAKSVWNIAVLEVDGLKQLFTGKIGMDEVSGPVGIVSMVKETTTYGLWYFGFLIAIICVNLAIINMLPLPALDGGRFIFILYSMITGKKVNAKVEGIVHAVGLILLLLLMVFVTWNDIVKLITK